MPPRKPTPHARNRSYAGHTEAERIAERRERLLTAAFEVFGTQGYRGATVRGVCKTAGLTERYFYESFADMETLFCATYQQQLDKVRATLLEKIPTLPSAPTQRTETMLRVYFSMMQDARLVRILHLEPLTSTRKIAELYQVNFRTSAMLATQLLRNDNPAIGLPDDVVGGIGLALSGASVTLAVTWMLDGYRASIETLIASAALVMQGTLKALAKAKPSTD